MTNIQRALIWAAAIILAALAAAWTGMDDNTAFALVAGLSAAAVASVTRKGPACTGCAP